MSCNLTVVLSLKKRAYAGTSLEHPALCVLLSSLAIFPELLDTKAILPLRRRDDEEDDEPGCCSGSGVVASRSGGGFGDTLL